jgi:hypothetical protein
MPGARSAPRRVAGTFAAACLTVGVVPVAHATNSNPNYLPFGENESFLGNAGVGRANDTGAVYYNPAGLTDIGEGRVSVSGAVYVSFHTHYDAIVHTDNTNIPFDYSGFNAIPSTYIVTRRVGDWVGALSILIPNSLKLDDHATFSTPNVTGNLVYSVDQSDLWIGLSAAHTITEHLSAGVTLFGIEHEQTSLIGADAQNVAAPTMIFSTLFNRQSLVTFGLAATAGLSYRVTDRVRFGARAQTALLQVYGKGDSYQVQRTLNGTPSMQGENVQGPANYGIPFDFSVGSALSPAPWMTILFDASLQLGLSYATFPSSALANSAVALVPTPRLNLGVELIPAPSFPIRLGAYWVPSANGGQPGDAGFQKEDFYGITAGVGINDEHVRTSVGGFYVWSTGEATPSSAVGTTAAVASRGYGGLLTTAYAF